MILKLNPESIWGVVLRVWLAILPSIFILLSLCCTAPEGESPPSSPPPPLPQSPETKPKVEWSSDGTITPGEYAGSNTYGEYEIHWHTDEQYVYIGMKAKTIGWLSVGIQPNMKMMDSDMIFGFVKEDKAMVYDLFSIGDFGPHPLDTELDGVDNILEASGSEEDGYTTIECKRALDTGDEYDLRLTKGVIKIIWAYGDDDKLTLKHTSRGYGELDL